MVHCGDTVNSVVSVIYSADVECIISLLFQKHMDEVVMGAWTHS